MAIRDEKAANHAGRSDVHRTVFVVIALLGIGVLSFLLGMYVLYLVSTNVCQSKYEPASAD
jgi:hypothetical protein